VERDGRLEIQAVNKGQKGSLRLQRRRTPPLIMSATTAITVAAAVVVVVKTTTSILRGAARLAPLVAEISFKGTATREAFFHVLARVRNAPQPAAARDQRWHARHWPTSMGAAFSPLCQCVRWDFACCARQVHCTSTSCVLVAVTDVIVVASAATQMAFATTAPTIATCAAAAIAVAAPKAAVATAATALTTTVAAVAATAVAAGVLSEGACAVAPTRITAAETLERRSWRQVV